MNKSKYLKYSKKIKLLQKGGGKCVSCLERAANIVAKPCNHAILCKLCASEFILSNTKCQICNLPFETILGILDNDAFVFIEENTIDIPHREPFLGTIDFLIYYVLKNDYIEVLDNDNITPAEVEITSESLFGKLLQLYPNVIENISDIDEFKMYLTFIIENEIWNKKNFLQYYD